MAKVRLGVALIAPSVYLHDGNVEKARQAEELLQTLLKARTAQSRTAGSRIREIEVTLQEKRLLEPFAAE